MPSNPGKNHVNKPKRHERAGTNAAQHTADSPRLAHSQANQRQHQRQRRRTMLPKRARADRPQARAKRRRQRRGQSHRHEAHLSQQPL
jgi:hypothetical protein